MFISINLEMLQSLVKNKFLFAVDINQSAKREEISLNRLEGAPENRTASGTGRSTEPLRQQPGRAADNRPPSGPEDRCPPGLGDGLSLSSSGCHLGSRTPRDLGN